MYLIGVEIKKSNIAGKGYFSTDDVPIGTIVYCYSHEDKKYSRDAYKAMIGDEKSYLEENGVENEFGEWIVTNTGPYTNHSCDSNILPLYINGKYTDIVVKDIKKGEEITIDYSLFYSSFAWSMECHCSSNKCRHKVGFGNGIDIETEKDWESKINNAIKYISKVEQPIFVSKDPNAINITKDIQEIQNKGTLGKLIKFSLINK